jgi:transcriptional regulator with XRE-family HTH domain
MDELRIGRIVRALRHRLDLPQTSLASRADCSQSTISLIERGRLDGVSPPVLRRVLRALDADLVLLVRWRGGELDRLLDERHASLGEALSRELIAAGWEVVPEVSFSIFGERGSIDLLAWHASSRTLLVVELKSELTSIEETLRRHDTKVRLASRIAAERFGWRPAGVGRLLVLPEGRTGRRHVERHATLFERSYPARNVAVRRWLREPAGLPMAGLLFLSSRGEASGMRVAGPRRRIRSARSRSATHEPTPRST